MSAQISFPRFAIHYEAKAKFDEYAAAAKTEIGGLMRVQVINGVHVAVDVKPLPQKGATATFELDTEEQMKFLMALAQEGRAAEAVEWMNIVHSHPVNCKPFLSGPDHENLVRISGDRHAWSLIMTRRDLVDTDSTDYAVHACVSAAALGNNNTFFTSGLVMQNMAVEIYHPEREAIREEVKTLIKEPPKIYAGNYSSGPSVGSGSGYQGTYQGGGNNYPSGGQGWSGPSTPYTQPQLGNGGNYERWGWDDPDADTNEAGLTAEDIQANLQAFEEAGIEEGTLVIFKPTPQTFSLVEDDKMREILIEMTDQEYTVVGFDEKTGQALLEWGAGEDGKMLVQFDPDELEVVEIEEADEPEVSAAALDEVG